MAVTKVDGRADGPTRQRSCDLKHNQFHAWTYLQRPLRLFLRSPLLLTVLTACDYYVTEVTDRSTYRKTRLDAPIMHGKTVADGWAGAGV